MSKIVNIECPFCMRIWHNPKGSTCQSCGGDLYSELKPTSLLEESALMAAAAWYRRRGEKIDIYTGQVIFRDD